MEFEDILRQVGGWGKFQRYLTLFFLIPVSFSLSCLVFNFIFMMSVPEHWCHIPELSNLTMTQQRMIVSPPNDPSCNMYKLNYSQFLEHESFKATSNISHDIIPCVSGWEYDKTNYDETAASKFDLVCDNAHYLSLLFSLQNFGSFFATLVCGRLSDRYGRKLLFLVLIIVGSSTEIAVAFVNDFNIFAILRTINGSVLRSIVASAFILVTEIVAPDVRAHINGLLYCFWYLGFFCGILLAYLSRSWVTVCIFGAACGFCILLNWSFLPESPSWLVSQGRYEDAATVMMRIGRINGKQMGYNNLLQQLQTLGEKMKQNKEQEKKKKWPVCNYSLLKYPRLRRHFFILSICWAELHLAYNGFARNTGSLHKNTFLNFFLFSVAEIPGVLTFWFLMVRYGRRWSSSLSLVLIGIICFITMPLLKYNSHIIALMIGKFFITGLWMITAQQAAELFPTVFRTFGVGAVKIIAMVAPFSSLFQYGRGLPFFVIGLTSFIAGVLASFLPETLNENLPQTVTDAEELGKDQKYFSWIKKRSRKMTEKENHSVESTQL